MAKSWNPSYLGAIAVDAKSFTATVASSTASTAATNTLAFQLVLDLNGANALGVAGEHSCTVSNINIGANTAVLFSVGLGTNTRIIWPACATVSAWQVILSLTNLDAANATNGTVTISVLLINPKGV